MIGKILGKRYEIVELIAEGGMSRVYKARDTNLNRFDAIKVLNEEFAKDEDILERFKKEANAVAFLSHPNIVNIYNVGSEDNLNYIVMEYVKGKTLKDVIKRNGPLPNEEIMSYSFQIARALEHAHKNNIIHRDIKPQNILLTEDKLVKVTDFGIAKHSDSATITNSGKIIGSAHYFSPEQARGNLTDGRSDIYSLGITMYELATGKVPFDADSPITIALKHMQEEIPSAKRINPNLDDDIVKIIEKCTEKNPIDRYQKVEDLVVDLRAVMSGTKLVNASDLSDDDSKTQVMSTIIPDEFGEDLAEDDYIYDSNEPDNKKRKYLIAGLVVILLVGLGAFVGTKVFNFRDSNISAEEEFELISIEGLLKDEAEERLREAGLKMEIQGTEKSELPVDTVIRTTPEPGTKVKKDMVIGVVLSEGEETSLVPDLRGKTKEEAEALLERYGFILLDVKEENNESIPSGLVIGQDPLVNTELKEGEGVSIIISKGAEVKLSTVPSVINKTLREAEAVLNSSGLLVGNVQIEETGNRNVGGRIKSQSVSEGTEIKEDSKIDLVIYEYKEVTIPSDLVGKTAGQAYNILNGLGLRPVYREGTQPAYIVLQINPSGGQSVGIGSEVSIVGDIPAPEPTPEPEPEPQPEPEPEPQPEP